VALTYGRDVARTVGATLHILHVANMLVATAGAEYLAATPSLQADIENTASRQLDGLLSVQDNLELRLHKCVRTSPAPAQAIVEYAEENGIDLIVMGTHGRNALARFLMGSVAARVIRSAPCPVMTVRTRDSAGAQHQPVAVAS
jgi:nucleotide-binding universal stress UspA family protein